MSRGGRLLVAALVLAAGVACQPAKKAPPLSTSFGPPMPEARTEVAGAYWEDEGLIAVAGGFAPNSQPTSSLFLFNLGTNTWSSGTTLPGNYDHASLAFLAGRLWLVGGYKNGVATNEVWSLESPGAAWVAESSLNVPRGALATVAAGGKLVAIGGANGGGQLAGTEEFDPSGGGWQLGPDLQVSREHLGAAAVGATVFAVAGRQPNLTSVEVRSVGGGGWQQGPTLRFSRGGNGAGTANGIPCTAGGEQASGTIPSIECLSGSVWQHVANLREPRHGLAVVGVGNQLHIIAGGPQPGFTFSATHEILTL